jgi:hypothetical protein
METIENLRLDIRPQVRELNSTPPPNVSVKLTNGQRPSLPGCWEFVYCLCCVEGPGVQFEHVLYESDKTHLPI